MKCTICGKETTKSLQYDIDVSQIPICDNDECIARLYIQIFEE